MQSLARPGSSGLSWAGSGGLCSPNFRHSLYVRRVHAPVTAYAASQTSQSSSGSSSSSQDKKEAGTAASNTIRSLDSLLGSTDDTEIELERESQYNSTSSSSVPAYSGSSAAVGLTPGRPQDSISRDFQGPSSPSRLALSCEVSRPQYKFPLRPRESTKRLDCCWRGGIWSSVSHFHPEPSCASAGGPPQPVVSKA